MIRPTRRRILGAASCGRGRRHRFNARDQHAFIMRFMDQALVQPRWNGATGSHLRLTICHIEACGTVIDEHRGILGSPWTVRAPIARIESLSCDCDHGLVESSDRLEVRANARKRRCAAACPGSTRRLANGHCRPLAVRPQSDRAWALEWTWPVRQPLSRGYAVNSPSLCCVSKRRDAVCEHDHESADSKLFRAQSALTQRAPTRSMHQTFCDDHHSQRDRISR
jgi:hypothetical protein